MSSRVNWPIDHYGYPLRGFALLDRGSGITYPFVADRALAHLDEEDPEFVPTFALGKGAPCGLCQAATPGVSALGRRLFALCPAHRTRAHAAMVYASWSTCGRQLSLHEFQQVEAAFQFVASGGITELAERSSEQHAARAREEFAAQEAREGGAARAADLLRGVLGEDALEHVRKKGWIEILAASGRTYRVHCDGRTWQVEHRRVRARFCVVHHDDGGGSPYADRVGEPLPMLDKVLGKALHLLSGPEGEAEFLRNAHATPLDAPVEALDSPRPP